MKIDDWYPSPKEIINIEFQTLRLFKDNHFCWEKLPTLANDANTYYSANYFKFNDGNRLDFNFESEINIKVAGKDGIAHLGALIELKDKDNIDRATYYVAICQEEDPKLLRKYHFDYAPSTILHRHRQPHPVFHLQYAGESAPRLREMKIDHSHLEPSLSEPRLYYFPLSLALLVNLILKEFPDDSNIKLTESSEWRNVVKKSESIILAPFFRRCQAFFSKKDSNRLFMNDFYYGN